MAIRTLICRQRGQAASEALVLFFGLVVLWVAVAWLGRIQDLALQAQHSARFASFMASRHEQVPSTNAIEQAYFSKAASLWTDRQGRSLRDSVYQNIDLTLVRGAAVSTAAQPGGSHVWPTRLRHDWMLADEGILTSTVMLDPKLAKQSLVSNQASNTRLFGLQEFDFLYPQLSRHVAILTGAGHAKGDQDTARTIAQSGLAWSNSIDPSYRLGRRLDIALAPLDAAWGRASPLLDWLTPWADRVPAHHLGASSANGHP